jgi:hypothetical protein
MVVKKDILIPLVPIESPHNNTEASSSNLVPENPITHDLLEDANVWNDMNVDHNNPNNSRVCGLFFIFELYIIEFRQNVDTTRLP